MHLVLVSGFPCSLAELSALPRLLIKKLFTGILVSRNVNISVISLMILPQVFSLDFVVFLTTKSKLKPNVESTKIFQIYLYLCTTKCTCADAQNQFLKTRFLFYFMLQCNKDKIWITEKLKNYTLALENKKMKALTKMNSR